MERIFLRFSENKIKVVLGDNRNSTTINTYVNIIELKIKIAMIKDKAASMCDISFLQPIVSLWKLHCLEKKKGSKAVLKNC